MVVASRANPAKLQANPSSACWLRRTWTAGSKMAASLPNDDSELSREQRSIPMGVNSRMLLVRNFEGLGA